MNYRMLTALATTVLAGTYFVTTASAQSTQDVGIQAFEQKWAADPATEGLDAFVGIEDDRSDSHPAGQPHITAEGDQYRFVMHRVDRDGSDRQRQEVRAIKEGDQRVDMHRGETWRYNYQMYIPTSLKATTSFTHIFQVKHSNVASPVITVSLNRSGSSERIELRLFGEGQAKVGVVDLVQLKNKWIDVEIEIKVDDGDNGSARYSLKSGGTTYVDAGRTGIDTWLGGDQAHPKWGIYRSISDSGQIQDTYLLLRNMRAYQLVDGGGGGQDYQAEAATITQGVVESNHTGYTGSGFVNGDNVIGSGVEFTVNAAAAGSTPITVRFANGTTANRPMSVALNGASPALTQSFPATGAWTTWNTVTFNLPLNAGANRIRLISTTANGGPNLDRLSVG